MSEKEFDYWENRELKIQFLERDKSCVYCNKELDIKNGTIDHVIPVSMGGKKTLSNLVLSCRACNESKGTLLPVYFIFRFHIKSKDTIVWKLEFENKKKIKIELPSIFHVSVIKHVIENDLGHDNLIKARPYTKCGKKLFFNPMSQTYCERKKNESK